MVTLLRDHVAVTGQTPFEAHGHATYVFSVPRKRGLHPFPAVWKRGLSPFPA